VTSRRLPTVVVLFGQQLAGALIVAAIVVATAQALPSGRTVGLSLLAGLAGALALGTFYRALAIGTMSVVAPISASGVTLPVVVGIASGERPSALQAVGLVVTFAGVILVSREEQGEQEGARVSRLSIVLALVAALGFGLFFTLTDAVADDSVLWLLLLARCASIVVVGALLAARPPAVRPRRSDLLPLAGIGALDLLATGLYAVAMTEGLLSVVAVIGALYPVATILLARGLLKERLRRAQLAGVVLAFAGVAAVAAG
jgi:drug/metabolite transporter (DMT)-like permease